MAKFGKIRKFQFLKNSHFNILVDVNLNGFVIFFFQNDVIELLYREDFSLLQLLIQMLKMQELKIK